LDSIGYQAIHRKLGFCHFYLVTYLKQLSISLMDLRKRVVQCLQHALNINDPRVSHYYNVYLSQDTLMTLHQIISPYEYLQRMGLKCFKKVVFGPISQLFFGWHNL